jgi:hypothetical protein
MSQQQPGPNLQNAALVCDLAQSILLKIATSNNEIKTQVAVQTAFFIAEEFIHIANERYNTAAKKDEEASPQCRTKSSSS